MTAEGEDEGNGTSRDQGLPVGSGDLFVHRGPVVTTADGSIGR